MQNVDIYLSHADVLAIASLHHATAQPKGDRQDFPTLASINLQVNGNEYVALATDRYVVAEVKGEAQTSGAGSLTFMLNSETWTGIAKQVAKGVGIAISAEIDRESGKAAELTLSTGPSSITTEPTPGEFPNVQRLFWDPTEANPIPAISVDPYKILQVAKVQSPRTSTLSAAKAKANPLSMAFMGESPHGIDGPILIERSIKGEIDPDFRAMVQPNTIKPKRSA